MLIDINNILEFLNNLNLKYDYIGSNTIQISNYAPINSVNNGNVTWIKNKSYYNKDIIAKLENVIIVINSDIDIKEIKLGGAGFIICDNPKEVFFSILNEFFPQKKHINYISSNSIVNALGIGSNVYIGHNCYIGDETTIGDNVAIKNNVSIEGKVIIGKNTIIHSGVIIGTDGFGYYQNEEGINMKVPHYGGVTIGENVEIGANTCIDRGTLENTVIGNNVKIDNLCHIGHNCIIKDNSSIIALSMLGGSVVLEQNAYIAPGAIIKNQLKIGQDSLVGLGAVVIKDVEAKKVVAGVPAKVIKDNS